MDRRSTSRAHAPRPARSRARSALSAGFCCSAIVNRSGSCHAGVCTAKLSVSWTVTMSVGASRHLLEQPQLLDLYRRLRAQQRDFRLAARHLRLTDVE